MTSPSSRVGHFLLNEILHNVVVSAFSAVLDYT